MLSEFSSDRYTPAQSSKFLDSFSISQGTEYVWFGIGVLVAYYLFFTTLNGLALHFIRYEKYKGVSVKAMTDNASEEDNVYVEVRTPGAGDVVQTKARGAGLPFTPSNLCIKDLEYFVTLPSGVEKQLLRGITAHFEPGRMVALMGATGAGKTTLMDVIAGRKTGGRIVGDIIVNGEPKDPANFSRITAYCEQMDIHSEAATIYEALVFSANLRLPPTFSEEERMNLVNETLELLELSAIAGEMVGRLSVEQKKRVTIGVEVVANPSILFLDEPTSGYLLPRTAMKAGYKWFTYLMPSSYSLAALVGAQFGDNQDVISVPSGNTTSNMTVAAYIEKTYDFRPERKYNFMAGLLVIWVVLQVAIYLTFKYVSHLKR
ncbi:ABC transporter G family member 29 [Phytophthora ramorum]|uniref:ABC transporter G family member 29 n=1 Tax=Phytophthora ramorum TaxID=164328 RepID=UPI0030956142|nr:ABC transporter G family member 29 [Phytophthora ramorum]